VGQAAEMVPARVQMAAAAVLAVLMVYNVWKNSTHGTSRCAAPNGA
jgi:hypothetical protein